MSLCSVARWLSTGLVCFAVALAAWGIFGMASFHRYSGEFYDPRFLIFDNGLYPFFWGAFLLVFCQLLRLRGARYATLLISIVGLSTFSWMRLVFPGELGSQKIFPDDQLLTELLLLCGALLAVGLADRYLQYVSQLLSSRFSSRC